MNGAYGDLFSPNETGSGGGGNSSYPGGNGEGLVRIVGRYGKAGRYDPGRWRQRHILRRWRQDGGGIRIEADTLTGNGKIYARGGASPEVNRDGGGGGGGRIAIYYQTMSLPVGNIVASRG